MDDEKVFNCSKKCCHIKYIDYQKKEHNNNRYYKKSGVFIYSPTEDRILLVQSRGNLWGIPKGTLNIGEKYKDGAIREVKEETGILLSYNDLQKYIILNDTCIYYYLEMELKQENIIIQKEDKNNDANGITWIKLDCLYEMIDNEFMFLNYHTKILIYKYLHKNMFKNVKDWILVKYD